MTIISANQFPEITPETHLDSIFGWTILAIFWAMTVGLGAQGVHIVTSRSDEDPRSTRLLLGVMPGAAIAFLALPLVSWATALTLPLPLSTALELGLAAALLTFIIGTVWVAYARRMRRGPAVRK